MKIIPNNKSRVLLFQVYPIWRGPESDMRLPLGMLYLGNSLKEAGYNVEVFHIEEAEIDNAFRDVKVDDILFIGVCSILTGFSLRCAISFSKKFKEKHPVIPIVWGGVQPSAIPDICLKEDFIDFVGIGEGEELIVEIAKMFNGLINKKHIKGLGYKNERNEIVVNERRDFIKKLDDYKPDYSLINLNNYIFNNKILGLIMSSRGCPYNCAFCYNQYINKRRWRKHSGEYVIQTLKGLHEKYNFKTFTFSDDNFFVENKRAMEILDNAYKIGLKASSVDIKINNIDIDDIVAMAKYEVESVFFGTESLNPRLINLIGKKQTKEQVVDILMKFAKYAPSLTVQTEILMALPFQNKSELYRDISDGLDLYKYNLNLSVYFGVLFPLPKTTMMEYANANGFVPQNLSDFEKIDLNSAWSICDQWVGFKLTERNKKNLYLTEKYSQLLSLDRRELKIWQKYSILFNIAKFRLKYQFFLLWKIDFFIYSVSFPKIPLLSMLRKIYNNTLKKVNSSVCYFNFGYIPNNSIKHNFKGKLFGHVNLLKRLQAKDIMTALDIHDSDRVLDFGCGMGFFTVEMAKLADEAVGIDINPYIKTIQIPEVLKGRLKYIQVNGEKLPFPDDHFDRILASEILPMITEPKIFLKEIRRVLKPGGRLVISNGAGHPAVVELYESKSKKYEQLKHKYTERFPRSYEEYEMILQESFGTGQTRFLKEHDIKEYLELAGYKNITFSYSPGYLAGRFFSMSQFMLYLKTGTTLSQKRFLTNYLFFSFTRLFERKTYKGGLICVSEN